MRRSAISQRMLVSAVLLVGCAVSAGAWAHAHLKSQTPAANSTVASPGQLQLQFSEGVEAGFSQVTVSDASGASIALKPLASASGDKKTLLVVPSQPLAAGDYTVNWKVVSVDTHSSSGSYQFKVGQ